MKATCTLDEAAKVLGVGVSTLYNHLTREGVTNNEGRDTLRVIRVGQRVLVPIVELERVVGGRVEVAS